MYGVCAGLGFQIWGVRFRYEVLLCRASGLGGAQEVCLLNCVLGLLFAFEGSTASPHIPESEMFVFSQVGVGFEDQAFGVRLIKGLALGLECRIQG